MNTARLYLLSTIVTTGMTFSGAMLNATLPEAGERPLAPASTTALVGACQLNGMIAETHDSIWAEFETVNTGTTATNFSFYYTVQLTPGASPLSRMMPVPREVTNGLCVVALEPGARHTERIPLPEKPRGIDTHAISTSQNTQIGTPGQPAKASLPVTPDHWMLLVSLEQKPAAMGWGGVLPATALVTNRLDKGILVLARSISPDKQAPAKE